LIEININRLAGSFNKCSTVVGSEWGVDWDWVLVFSSAAPIMGCCLLQSRANNPISSD